MDESGDNWASEISVAWLFLMFSIVMPGIAILGRGEPGIEYLYIWLIWLPIQLIIVISIAFLHNKERTIFSIDNSEFITCITKPLEKNGYSLTVINNMKNPLYPILRSVIFNYIIIVSHDSGTMRIYINEKDKIVPAESGYMKKRISKIYIGPISKVTNDDVRRVQSIIIQSVDIPLKS